MRTRPSQAGGGSEIYYDNIKVYKNKIEPADSQAPRARQCQRATADVRTVMAMTAGIASRGGFPRVASFSDPGSGDWPMWGGTPDRNMVSTMKGLPTTWDLKTKKNVKWVAELGSQAYGNPVVAGGMVLRRHQQRRPRAIPNVKGDKGVLMAFRESDGQFMWQAVHDKLAAGRANDWPYPGHLLVAAGRERRRLLHVESRRADGGGHRRVPRRQERRSGQGREADARNRRRHHLALRHDGRARRHAAQHGELVAGRRYENLIFVSTSNGQDESHVNIPSPKAPAIIAVDKTTGKLVWEDNSVGEKILHGQWSSPAVGKVGDTVQVVVGQGDGWVRGYEAKTGKKLWEFDLNPKDSVWPKTRNEVISTPVIYENVVYIANGRIRSTAKASGTSTRSIRPSAATSPTSGRIWHYGNIRRSISTGAIYNGILFYSDFSGFLHALDVKTGKPFWTHDMFAAIWGSPMVIDGKVYLGDEDGDVTVLNADKTLKVIAENNMGSSVYSTPVPANGTLFIVNRNQLFAIARTAAHRESK